MSVTVSMSISLTFPSVVECELNKVKAFSCCHTVYLNTDWLKSHLRSNRLEEKNQYRDGIDYLSGSSVPGCTNNRT